MDRERAYIESVRDRLERAGFSEEPPPDQAILKARRRQAKVTRAGLVETVVVVRVPATEMDAEGLREFGEEAVRAAAVGKSRLPRGLGSSLVVYPVVVLDGISGALAEFVEKYTPKHWATMEFPVVVDPSAKAFVVGRKTPVWGAAYYRKARSEANDLLAPGG